MPPAPISLPLNTSLLKPGMRIAIGLSGGADSVALLRTLAARSRELGLVLHVAHLHHGLRGGEADADLAFCRDLAAHLDLPFHQATVDTTAEARPNPQIGKPGETIEEAARRLRYEWFRQLLASGEIDAVATAHTLDDQAETVLARFLRGAWTEGLAGIHPVIQYPEGRIFRPLLAATRAEVEACLNALRQPWREDSSNRHLTFTRNRIRHELLPLLETWNPRLREHLCQMAVLALDEESWWQQELDRLAPQLVLEGRPVRGGGRLAGAGIAIDVTRFAALHPALQRRILRHAAARLGAAPDFSATEALRHLALLGRAGQKLPLPAGFRAERTPRELRLLPGLPAAPGQAGIAPPPDYHIPIPGEISAPAFGLHIQVGISPQPGPRLPTPPQPPAVATLRNWKPGDRVRLRHSNAPRKVKEVLERLHITGTARELWPVLEAGGRIVWMQGVDLEPEFGLSVAAGEIRQS